MLFCFQNHRMESAKQPSRRFGFMRAQIHQKATEMGYFHTPSQDSTEPSLLNCLPTHAP